MKKLSNSEMVEIVYRNHHKWVLQVARNFTQEENAADDLVQDLYLSLMQMADINKIRFNDTVNLFYLYKILKSKFLNGIKQTKKINTLPVEEDFLEIKDDEYNFEKDQEFENMLEATRHLLKQEVHWYDAMLLQTYIDENHSIASLNKVTKISKSSIWTSLNKTKKFIRDSYDERREEINKQQSSNSQDN